jgi:hypothetical protein
MTTENYPARLSYTRYDDHRHLLYLNEQHPVTFTIPRLDQTVENSYSYTGDMIDGATIIEARDVTDENRRQKYIAGLIGKKYPIDAQIAILANGADTEARNTAPGAKRRSTNC